MSAHLDQLRDALAALESQLDGIERIGCDMADVLLDGGRVLTVGNGGSAAHAQHLTAELVGRYGTVREPLSAICLHADASAVTALVNDFGPGEMFARQVRAHGRPRDVLVALSTSGTSPNVVRAAENARAIGMRTWALTGRSPNPLARVCDDALTVDGPTPTVQEVHQVAIHLVCAAVDRRVAVRTERSAVEVGGDA